MAADPNLLVTMPAQPAAQPPVVPPQPTSRPPSEAEYTHLISFFKYLVTITLTALTIIIGAGAVFFYRSMSDVKNDAKTSIESTTKAADAEISKIQSGAAEIARTEAQRSIDDAFTKGNVQAMIERTARERVNTAVDREIQKNLASRISQLQLQVAEAGEISNAGARLRLGFRPALDTLLKKAASPNPYVSQYAKSTLILIGSDYETRMRTGFGGGPPGMKDLSSYMNPPPKTLKDLMVVIRTNDDANIVAAAFAGFRELSGTKVQVFDLPAAEKWCDDHKPKCE